MLIVFQNLNSLTIVPALLLGVVFDVYYLRCSPEFFNSRIFQYFKKWLPVQCLPIESAESLGEVRYYDYGIEALLYHRVNQLLPQRILQSLRADFPNITSLDSKLKLTLASFLSYSDVGSIALFLGVNCRYRQVLFIHSTFGSYAYHVSNIPASVNLHHFFFPSNALSGLLSKIIQRIFWLFEIFLKPKETLRSNLNEATNQQYCILDTAVIFHQSTSYGNMFRKGHYFSGNNHSRLHPSNVLSLVLDRQQPLTDLQGSNDTLLRDFHRTSNLRSKLDAVKFFFFNAIRIRSLDELLGIIFLTRMYYAVQSWKEALLEYPRLKNVIIDYDILFPKALSIALECRGIRTIALQERGSASFASIYCAINDTYLFCGGIFTEYGKSNPSIACRQAIDFGAWRTTFLMGANVPAFNDLSMQRYGDASVIDFAMVIAVLGWFTSKADSEMCPFTNSLASLDLYKHVKSLALAFPDVAVVLRLKILDELDRQAISENFSGIQNIFLCDEYSKMNASYTLCKRADVIVSVQTSLADECLAAGKKVVVLDSTHNLKNICTDIYPKEFHFAFASDSQSMLDLVARCLNGDAKLVAQYDKLKEQLVGEFDLSTPNIIPDTLERLLI